MVGLARLGNLQTCAETVYHDGIAGDFLEAGVWRGGASIFLRALIQVLGPADRDVWVLDSFEGFLAPDAQGPRDRDTDFRQWPALTVSLEEVKSNFMQYQMLDEHVHFVKGWVPASLPGVTASQLSILRLDMDLYDPTFSALSCLYPRLSRGGFVIIDDYHVMKEARLATDEFRASVQVQSPLTPVDRSCVYWRKE